MKKNRTGTLILLLFACGLLLLVYFVILNKTVGTDEDSGSLQSAANSVLAQVKTTDIKAISYENGSEALEFVYTDDKWQLASDSKCPLNQDLLTALAESLATVESIQKVEDPSELSVYGLDEPKYSFSFTAKNVSYSFKVGNYNNFNNSYYCTSSESSDIDMLSADFISSAAFDRGLYDFIVSDTSTEIAEESITSLTLSQNGTELESTDAEAIKAVSDISLNSCYLYKAADEELESFGLSSPLKVKVNYTAEHKVQADDYSYVSKVPITVSMSFTYYIGGNDGNGNVYIMMEGSKMVYKISSELADAISAAFGSVSEAEVEA